MLFKSEIVTQASGSVGGVTYSRNSAGMYRRARAIPTNPNSAAQQTVRNTFTSLAQAWNNVLTEAQRDSWRNYAANSPITGRLGDPLALSGQQMYIRCNAVRIRGDDTRVDDGPILSGLIDLSPPLVDVDSGAGTISITFNPFDNWVNEDGGGLASQSSRFVSPGINFLRGPLRNYTNVQGGASPPSTPVTGTANAFLQEVSDAQPGQKIGLRFVAFRADGRISAPQELLVTVT